MPRTGGGTPAARALLEQLAARGIAATPRRLESLWQAGLIPRITGKAAPSPRTVEHAAAVLSMLGERKRYPGVAARVALRGFDIDDEIVRRDLLAVIGADDIPAPAERDTENQEDGIFAEVENLASLVAESENVAAAELRRALRDGVEAAEATRPAGEPVLEQRDSLLTNLAGMCYGQAPYAPQRLAETVSGLLPPELAADPVMLVQVAQVIAEPGHRFDASTLGGPFEAVVEGDPVVFTDAALYVEPISTLPIPALVADARRLLIFAASWLRTVRILLPGTGSAEDVELLAFRLAAGLASIRSVTTASLAELPAQQPAQLPSDR